MLTLLTSLALAATPVYADGRDDRTLLPQKLMNRNLSGQMLDYRLATGLDPFFGAADLQLSTQAPLDGGSPTTFHGYFVADTYLAFEVFEGLDVNLNVMLLNTTASGGFRVLSDVLPGVNAHLHLTLGELGGDPVKLDFLTTDLDLVTLGEGLLVETTPLEGFRGGFRWKGMNLEVVFGGRVFWGQDDLLSFAFSAFDGQLGASYTRWFFGFQDATDLGPAPDGNFASLFGHWEAFDGMTLSGELSARLGGPDPISTAALLRADLMHAVEDFSVHIGYQFRWYQGGFGPFDQLATPTTIPSTPNREDFYATNSFEYLWATPFFHQWSNTVMIEAKYRIAAFEIFVEVEWWLRFVRDRNADQPRLVKNLDGDLYPGQLGKAFYRAGTRLYPFDGLPHRIIAFVSNKSVNSFGRATVPVPSRFIDRPIFFIEAEVRL